MDRYNECLKQLAAAQSLYQTTQENTSSTRQELTCHVDTLKDLLMRQSSLTSLVNSAIEAGERLYSSTGPEGRDIIRQQLIDLQQVLEMLYDGVGLNERELQAKMSSWSGFDECREAFEKWLKGIESHLRPEIELKTTLDEKRAQLQVYRNVLHDIQLHQQDLFKLRDKADELTGPTDRIDKMIDDVRDRHATVQQRASAFVER